MTSTRTISILTLLAVLLAACGSTPIDSSSTSVASRAAPSAPVPVAATPAAPAAPRPAPASAVAPVALPAHLDPKSANFTDRSVYFDFDEFAIKPEYVALIERHGKYLASNPALTIKIEGNADERGGSEYNLALGQKRAQAVLQALRIYGVKTAQMEAISWGKERPKALGHDEAAWAQNRRADLQYPKQ